MSSKPLAQWYLYMIKMAGGQLYTGISKDVERRFAEHQSGSTKAARSLRGKGPLQLVFSCPAGDHSQALRLEYHVKQLTAKQKKHLVQHKCLPSDLIFSQTFSKTT